MSDRFPRAVLDRETLQRDDMKALMGMETPEDMPFSVTKIGHVVLLVSDLERSTEFYTKVLGLKFAHAMGADKVPSTREDYPHLQVETLDEVFRARKHLNEMGVKIEFEGRRRAGCQVAVEFHDPDGHFLEIYWGLDQLGPHDKARPPEEWTPAASLEEAIDNAPPGQDMTLKDSSLRK